MKTTNQIKSWRNWKTTTTLLILGLILAGLSIQPLSAMCAKFLGIETYFESDGLGMYCDGGDVLCGSAGVGFVLTTTYAGASGRKAWIDLKSAFQYPGYPVVPAKSLPRGMVEVELFGMTPNNPDGTCIPGAVGSPLHMLPTQTYLSSLRIRIFDGKNWFDLRFGHSLCEAVPSPCPVIVKAGADFDGDGFADLWTIEPSTPDATAILFKGKPNYSVPPGTVMGFFKVPFKLEFTRE